MNKKIYVGNLPYSIDDIGLARIFEPFGAVASAKVITERPSGRSKGFGFVEMAAPDADKAIEELNGKEFGGRTLRVDAASDKPTNDGSGPRRFNPRGGRM